MDLEADPLGMCQGAFTLRSWGMGYCDPEQGSKFAPEGLVWVSGVKFAYLLEGGHELLHVSILDEILVVGLPILWCQRRGSYTGSLQGMLMGQTAHHTLVVQRDR